MNMAITEITRRDLFDAVRASNICLHGRLDEIEFLSRVHDLRVDPSKGQSRVSDEFNHFDNETKRHDFNGDYEKIEIIDMQRCNLIENLRSDLHNGDDDTFLHFLCETVHPLVRPDAEEVERLLQIYNTHLNHDGFQIVEKTKVSGKPIYAARNVGALGIPNLSTAKQALDLGSQVATKITRMETSVDSDPEQAIGTAKDLVETCCRTILKERGKEMPENSKTTVPGLVKDTCRVLALTPDDIPGDAKAVETIKRLLSNLATIVHGVAELRNAYGTGHGKPVGTKGLQPRHAKLVVGAATTLAVFLVETHQVRGDQKGRKD